MRAVAFAVRRPRSGSPRSTRQTGLEEKKANASSGAKKKAFHVRVQRRPFARAEVVFACRSARRFRFAPVDEPLELGIEQEGRAAALLPPRFSQPRRQVILRAILPG